MPDKKLALSNQMQCLRERFDGENGLRELEKRLVRFHNVASEIEAKNRARGYEYGWVDGNFVITKYPDIRS